MIDMRKPIRKNRTTGRNIPKRIYLQVGDNDFADFKEMHEVTWCADKVEQSDIEYVLASELTAYKEALSKLVEIIKAPIVLDKEGFLKELDNEVSKAKELLKGEYND